MPMKRLLILLCLLVGCGSGDPADLEEIPTGVEGLEWLWTSAETFSHPSDSGVLRLDLTQTAVGGWALGVATGTIVPGPTFPVLIEFDLVHANFGTTRFTGVLVDGRLVGRLNGSLASYVFVDALVTLIR